MSSPMSRVRGLGSAKEGAAHWWAQRVTAIALVPLVIWYAVSLVTLIGADRDRVVEWLQSPVAAIASISADRNDFLSRAVGYAGGD